MAELASNMDIVVEDVAPVVIVPATRHESLWFDDGDVVLQAGSKLYKVHRFMLSRDSEFMKAMFSLPQSVVTGSVDNPIQVLDGTERHPLNMPPQITSPVFSSILNVLYCRWSEIPQLEIKKTDTESIALLRAVHMLDMMKVFDSMLPQLQPHMSHISCFQLAIECGRYNWAAREFTAIAVSYPKLPVLAATYPLGLEMAYQLSVAISRISQARLVKLGAAFNKAREEEDQQVQDSPSKKTIQKTPCTHIGLSCFSVCTSTSRALLEPALAQLPGYVANCRRCKSTAPVLLRYGYLPSEAEERAIALEVWKEGLYGRARDTETPGV